MSCVEIEARVKDPDVIKINPAVFTMIPLIQESCFDPVKWQFKQPFLGEEPK